MSAWCSIRAGRRRAVCPPECVPVRASRTRDDEKMPERGIKITCEGQENDISQRANCIPASTLPARNVSVRGIYRVDKPSDVCWITAACLVACVSIPRADNNRSSSCI